jgi:hypothetical protein
VERETAERGAQLAGQGERPRVTTLIEGLERRLAALGQDAAALDGGRVELGEKGLRGLALELVGVATQRGGARDVAQDAAVQEAGDLRDVGIGQRLGGVEARAREGSGLAYTPSSRRSGSAGSAARGRSRAA